MDTTDSTDSTAPTSTSLPGLRPRAFSLTGPPRNNIHADQPGRVSHPASRSWQSVNDSKLPARMHRQDSGYASIGPRSPSLSRTSTRRRPSLTNTARSSSSNIGSGSRSGPATRRSATTGAGAVSRPPLTSKRSRLAQYAYRGSTTYLAQTTAPMAFFHFPAPDSHESTGSGTPADAETQTGNEEAEAETFPDPPQTTHYWTSDSTRRLEYEAIDKARRGFKGWMVRHVVPDCFVPKDLRRPAFDDEAGSVRRYRLELENEDSASKKGEVGPEIEEVHDKKKRWFGRLWPCNLCVFPFGKKADDDEETT